MKNKKKMKMKNKKREVISIILIVLLLLLFLVLIYLYIINLFSNTYSFRELDYIVVLTLIGLSLYTCSYLLTSIIDKYEFKPMIISTKILFIIYLMTLSNLLFFSNDYGRQGISFIFNTKVKFNEFINIIPFKTIFFYILNGFSRSSLVNILGNILAFMPFAFFLTVLFPKLKEIKKFITVMILIIFIAEIIQLIFMVGRFDIDDLILNLTGVIVIYYLLKVKFIKININKLFKP